VHNKPSAAIEAGAAHREDESLCPNRGGVVSSIRQFFTPADLSMLDRVLTRAGFRDVGDETDREGRIEATRQLMASFQSGTTGEAALLASLQGASAVEKTPVERAGYDIAAKIFSERFRLKVSSPPERQGYRFCKRIEIDGSWTIYHVFTGVPAQFGSWNMVQM
jgi:hypothetical protein